MLSKYTPLFFLLAISLHGHRLTYSPEEFNVGQSKCFVLDGNSTAKEKPWVWYAPTLPHHPDPSHSWYIDKLLEKRISFAGCDQGEVRGSPKSVDRFTNFYKEMVHRGYSQKPVLLGQSRGGLMMLSWAVKNPNKLAAYAGVYPVLNLESWPTKRNLSTTLKDFGMDQDTFLKSVDLYNPIEQLDGLARANVPFFIVHGDSDRLVPIEENSEILINRLTKLGGKAEVKVVPGRGHQVVDDFFKSKELIEFIIQQSIQSLRRI